MKKQLAALCTTVILSLSLLTGCGAKPSGSASLPTPGSQTAQNQEEEQITTRIAALKGPTSMGLVKMMKDHEGADSPYSFDMYTAADEVVPLIAKNEVDIALVPTNLAAVLYQKTEGGIAVIDINAGNVLFVVSHDQSLSSIDQLAGKTIYMTGKGTTPEWSLRHLLQANNLSEDDLTIEFKAEPAEVVSALQQNADAAGVLPQPFAMVAATQENGPQIRISFAEEWAKASQDTLGGIATGVTIVRRAFLGDHPAQVQEFLNEHAASVEYVSKNPEEGGRLVEEYGIVKAPIAQKVLEQYNPLCAVAGTEMKAWLEQYLEVLYEIAPASVGGALPDEAFYYLG